MTTDFRAYTPKLGRHIRSLAINGFFARDLDADDHAFIESVRERGYIDGADSYSSLFATYANTKDLVGSGWRDAARSSGRAGSEFFDAETLDYFEQKWAFEDQVREERRLARQRELAAARERREARLRDKTIAAEELAREQAAWDAQRAATAQERELRMLQTMLDDLEWDRASPAPGRTVPDNELDDEDAPITETHYQKGEPLHYAVDKVRVRTPHVDKLIPEAKASPRRVLETEWQRTQRAERERTEHERKVRAEQRRVLKQQERRMTQERIEEAQKLAAQVEAEKIAAQVRGNQAEQAKLRAAREAERIARENILAAQREVERERARAHNKEAARLQAERIEQDRLAREAAAAAGAWEINRVENMIMIALRGSYPKVWSVEELMTFCNCKDRNLIIYCGHAIVQAGQANRTAGPL